MAVREESPTTTDTASPNFTTGENRNLYSSTAPHVAEPFAPLDTLVRKALRQYGEMHPGTVEGETISMFIDFANEIIEDLRAHPYWGNVDIDYYKHQEETREIPDLIMVAGLIFYYSVQQHSDKVRSYSRKYYQRMNQILHNRKYGAAQIVQNTFDKDADNANPNPFKALPGAADDG